MKIKPKPKQQQTICEKEQKDNKDKNIVGFYSEREREIKYKHITCLQQSMICLTIAKSTAHVKRNLFFWNSFENQTNYTTTTALFHSIGSFVQFNILTI